MPAVGPDGKNVMKLIPVQKVNGQFVHTPVLSAKNDTQAKIYSQLARVSLASSPQNRLPTLQAIGDGRFILKTPPEGNTLVTSGESHQHGANELFKNSVKQVQVPQVTPKVTQNALQLPFQNKKPPFLPSGHYLQIPPNATVRTLPASALPQSIKKRICNSANVPSNPVKGLPTVVYVSPVNSLKLGSSQQLPCLTKPNELPQTTSYSPTTSSRINLNISSAPHSVTTQGVTTPMKWVVQEGTGCTAPCLIPVTSPSMTSDILKAVKQMEAAKLVHTAVDPTSTSQEKVNPGKDNALVMYNGKVYFVAKKDSEITKDVITETGNVLKTSPETLPNSAQSSGAALGPCTSSVAQKKVNELVSEIIDLCGDDEESSTSTRLDGLPEASKMEVQNDDDSNVIFVSYIPPKSESETSHKITVAAQPAPETQVDSRGDDIKDKDIKNSSTSVTGIDLNVGCEDEAPVLENVERKGSVSKQPQSDSDQGTDIAEGDSALLGRQNTEAVAEVPLEKPALNQICQPKSDSELRQIFGITFDLRICLQRSDLITKPDSEADGRSDNKRTLEGIRRIILQSQETKTKHLIQTQVSTPRLDEESGPINAKRQKLEQDECTSSDTTTPVTTDTLPDPNNPGHSVRCEEGMQSVTTMPCADSKVLQTCPKERTLSSVVACAVAYQTPVSPCPSSSLQPQTAPVVSCTDDRAVSRKTPHRVSKGCGRVCTACPCGTKVGAMSTALLSKPEEKPVLPAAVDSTGGAVDVNKSSRDKKMEQKGDKVVESPISRPQDSSGVPAKAGDDMVHSSRADIGELPFHGTCSVRVASSHLEEASHLDISSKETICSITPGAVTQEESCEQNPGGQQETVPQEQYTLDQVEGKVPSSSVEEARDVGDGFPYELFSSLLLDPEEIKRQERIKRLKDLLREKEAALKKLRQNM
ncbi:ligand-dependent nuclear receptor-interacting factor 1 isoform X2 [Brachyhypopomus gauderio]